MGSISCYFMLQITNLEVCKCILCSCVMILHTPHMYFRLQPVLSSNLCSAGFAHVDAFFEQVCFTENVHKSRVFAAINSKIGAN